MNQRKLATELRISAATTSNYSTSSQEHLLRADLPVKTEKGEKSLVSLSGVNIVRVVVTHVKKSIL